MTIAHHLRKWAEGNPTQQDIERVADETHQLPACRKLAGQWMGKAKKAYSAAEIERRRERLAHARNVMADRRKRESDFHKAIGATNKPTKGE